MKKSLTILLLGAMLISTAACAGGDDSASTTTAADTTVAGEVEETTTADPRPDLPKEDYDGYEFRSLSRGISGGSTHWYIFDTVWLEDYAGDVVNDEVQKRNTYIEETYNVKISMIDKTDATTAKEAARTAVLANADEFDIYGDSISSSASLAAEGMLVDFNDLLYCDLDADYWDQRAREQLSIAGKLYTMLSDFTLMDKHGTWITLFNKGMIADYGFESPYDMVTDGTWTLDAMYNMAQEVAFDVDGDGAMNEHDSFGTAGESWNFNALMLGADVMMFRKNDDDIPELSLDGERTINAFEKAYKILADKNITLYALAGNFSTTLTDYHVEGFGPMMEDNRLLFYITGMNRVILFRGLDCEFGIIPNPKYDETQDDYHVILTYGNTNSISVPITNTDLDRTSILLEALSYESSVTSYPAYIEKTIKGKHLRDEESIAMLDIIFNSRAFDLGHIFNWGSCASLFQTTLGGSTSPDPASTIAANEANYTAKMLETVALFTE